MLTGCSSGDRSHVSVTDSSASVKITDSITDKRVYAVASLDEYKAMYALQSYLTKATDSAEIIDFDCAVLIYPTEQQMEETKNTLGDDNFYIVADDNNWYQGRAIGLLDSLNIRHETAGGKYLTLKGRTKTWTLDIRKDNLPAWNLIFFKTTKEPRIIPTAGLSITEIKEYFEIAE
jgi:hypothetical protein